MSNRIEKQIDLKASSARVWQALTDHVEFGQWFRVALDEPFEPGRRSRGHITYPAYEHLKWDALVLQMKPEYLFSFSWHPYAIDAARDYSGEMPTLVEFRLEPSAAGTRLRVSETGFEQLPDDRRAEALRMNEAGWEIQMKNIAGHIANAS